VKAEKAPVFANTGLAKEDRTFAIDANQDGNRQKDWTKKDESEDGSREIEQSL
jgi:hypothetical protein